MMVCRQTKFAPKVQCSKSFTNITAILSVTTEVSKQASYWGYTFFGHSTLIKLLVFSLFLFRPQNIFSSTYVIFVGVIVFVVEY